jgi:methionine synthase I (cobalamin-dependent)
MAKKIKDVNISINSIGVSAVSLAQKRLKEQQKIIQDIGIGPIYDYIFGKSEENPLEEVTKRYNDSIEILHNKIVNIVNIEKANYLGKKKKGVNFIKKLKIED